MAKESQHNPLISVILQVLQQNPQRLAIHHLLAKIQSKISIPKLDNNEQLALFKLNWLMMNALYQLQQNLLHEGYCLHISTLDIHIEAITHSQAKSSEVQSQKLRDYYLDWTNFNETSVAEVNAMLEGIWQDCYKPEQKQQAFNTLGLKPNANKQAIKLRYRELANKHHPDKGGNTETFMQIRQAYELLKSTITS